VRFVLKEWKYTGSGHQPEVYDYETGELTGRVGPRGAFVPFSGWSRGGSCTIEGGPWITSTAPFQVSCSDTTDMPERFR